MPLQPIFIITDDNKVGKNQIDVQTWLTITWTLN